jgi:myo-inositol-1(or 4)-monophosphatase
VTSDKGRKPPPRSPAKRAPATRGARTRPVRAGAGAAASGPGRELLGIAIEAAERAARIVRRRAADLPSLTWREKSQADFVSDVDTSAEAAIAGFLEREVPEARLIGEELSPDLPIEAGTGITFVADPLDGTTNYLHGYPAYAVSIGVLVDGVLTAAVVHNVPLAQRYTALAGAGAFHGEAGTATRGPGARRRGPLAGRRLAVSSCAQPSRALIGTGFPFKTLHLLPEYQRQFAAVTRRTAGVRRAGSAALDLADVAAGRFDAFWELSLAPWDVAAGILLVREAGGVVTNVMGATAPVAHGPIVAGNPVMHAWLLATMHEADAAP